MGETTTAWGTYSAAWMPSPDTPWWGLSGARGPRKWRSNSRMWWKSHLRRLSFCRQTRDASSSGRPLLKCWRQRASAISHLKMMMWSAAWWKGFRGHCRSLYIAFSPPGTPGTFWMSYRGSWTHMIPHTIVLWAWAPDRPWRRILKRSGTTFTRRTPSGSLSDTQGNRICNLAMQCPSARPRVICLTRAIWAVGVGNCSGWPKG